MLKFAFDGIHMAIPIELAYFPTRPKRLMDLGRSMGNPKARLQMSWAKGPKARLTPNVTV